MHTTRTVEGIMDIVMPNGNEEELIEMAQKIGVKELIFYYDKKMPSGKVFDEIKIAKALGMNGKADLIIAESSDKNRGLIEQRKVDMIYGWEFRGKKEFMNIRNSGMNQVIAKLMKEKKVSYCINFNSLVGLDGVEKAKIIGRIMQNLRLCRKYKVNVVIGTFAKTDLEMRNQKDLEAFLNSLR